MREYGIELAVMHALLNSTKLSCTCNRAREGGDREGGGDREEGGDREGGGDS